MAYDPVQDFLDVFDAFCVANGCGEFRNSRVILNGGHRVGTIKAGGDIGGRMIKEAMQRMSDEWPTGKGYLWPTGIPRPKKNRKTTEAA